MCLTCYQVSAVTLAFYSPHPLVIQKAGWWKEGDCHIEATKEILSQDLEEK